MLAWSTASHVQVAMVNSNGQPLDENIIGKLFYINCLWWPKLVKVAEYLVFFKVFLAAACETAVCLVTKFEQIISLIHGAHPVAVY